METFTLKHPVAGYTGTAWGIDFVGGTGTTSSRYTAWTAVHTYGCEDVGYTGQSSSLALTYVPSDVKLIDGRPVVFYVQHVQGGSGFNGPLAGVDFVNGIGSTTDRTAVLNGIRLLGWVDLTPDYDAAAKTLIG
jgi:hypothetical protein